MPTVAELAKLTRAERFELLADRMRAAGQALAGFGAVAEVTGPSLLAFVEAYGAACRAPGRPRDVNVTQ